MSEKADYLLFHKKISGRQSEEKYADHHNKLLPLIDLVTVLLYSLTVSSVSRPISFPSPVWLQPASSLWLQTAQHLFEGHREINMKITILGTTFFLPSCLCVLLVSQPGDLQRALWCLLNLCNIETQLSVCVNHLQETIKKKNEKVHVLGNYIVNN